MDQVSKWKLRDQEEFANQENHRLEPESESESEVAQSNYNYKLASAGMYDH